MAINVEIIMLKNVEISSMSYRPSSWKLFQYFHCACMHGLNWNRMALDYRLYVNACHLK